MIPTLRKMAVLLAVFYALQVLAVHVAVCFPTKSLTLPVADGQEVTVESFFFGADYPLSLIPGVGLLSFYMNRNLVISFEGYRWRWEVDLAGDIDWHSFQAVVDEKGMVVVKGRIENESVRTLCRFPAENMEAAGR